MNAANNNAMEGLLGKIYSIMTAPNSVVDNAVGRRFTTSSEPPFISFCSPGIAIENLDFGDLSTKDQVNACSAFSEIVNSVPAVNGIWQKTDRRVWDIYELAITDVILPEEQLTASEEAMLKRAENFLREEVETTDPFTLEKKKEVRPTAAYQAYDSLFTAYGSVLKNYNNKKITATSDPTPEHVQDWVNNGPLYEQEVRNAYSRWGSLGYRDYVTKANGIIANLTGRGPFALYERLRSDFIASAKKDFRGFTFHPTFAYPSKILTPQFASAWVKYTFSSNEIQQFASSSRSSWGGGVGVSFGLWSVGGGTQYSNSQSRYTCDTKNMSVEVELMQVPLQRPWLNSWIFSSRGWKGGSTIGGDGSISSGRTPLTGMMPLYPTSMILARNLKVKINMTSTENKAAASAFSASASVGWGPFSIRGNYSSSQSSSSHNFKTTSDGFTVDGTQIIAFICDVLPKSPNADPSLKWPTNNGRAFSFLAEEDDLSFLEQAMWLAR